MSGTSYGACILHVSPEAYIGGPLALVRTGDMITVDVPARSIHLEVSEAELARPPAAWVAATAALRARLRLDVRAHILQADEGCDFDYLETSFGAPVGEPDIF
jgi:dihydroxyacid dehydratase/phosphogluconate dehydratase